MALFNSVRLPGRAGTGTGTGATARPLAGLARYVLLSAIVCAAWTAFYLAPAVSAGDTLPHPN